MKSSGTSKPFHQASFVKGIIGTDPILEETNRLHLAFAGRSNVGKSSLINAVLGRRGLVKSSTRPGKTTEINFFAVDEHYYFVDLPGYGFARMGEKQRGETTQAHSLVLSLRWSRETHKLCHS